MTILQAMQSASLRLVGYRPQVFFNSSGKFEMEIVDLVNEVAKDICEGNDWQSLTKIQSFVGDGVTDAFPYPEDYKRQLINTNIQDLNNWAWNYQHLTDINQFMFIRARGFQIFPGSWTIYDNKFQFTPPPPVGESASFPYISTHYAMGQSGVSKPEFTEDTDSFVINDANRLLTLGLIWRWRENKKLDYTGDQEAFMDLFDKLAARDAGSKIIRKGRKFVGVNTTIAYPWSLGV